MDNMNLIKALEYCNGELVICLSGEIDRFNMFPLRETIDEKIRELCPKKLVLDVTDMTFHDSSGVGFLLGRDELIKELGGTLTLRNPNSQIMHYLTLLGLDKFFEIK